MKLNVLCPQCGRTKPDPEQPCPACAATAEQTRVLEGPDSDRWEPAASGDPAAAGSPFAPGYEPVRVELPPAPPAPWAGIDEDRLVWLETAAACVTTSLMLLVAAALVSLFFAGGAFAIAGLGAGLAAIGLLSRRSRQATLLVAAHLLLLLGVMVTGAAPGSHGTSIRLLAVAACAAAAWIALGPRLVRRFQRARTAS